MTIAQTPRQEEVEIPASSTNVERPETFPMKIQGGMLEALGINMYTSIGKCLVEFIANAYDSDAKSVKILIPYADIGSKRHAARATARADAKEKGLDGFTVLLAPLPDDVLIVIEDDGHGMSPRDIREKFMPLNRRRRSDPHGAETQMMSESGRRFVMGRKGLGKLAGFGAAEHVEITTKRAGETFSTTFVMEYERLRDSKDLTGVSIPATYKDSLPAESQGTTITLRRLKCDAVKQSADTIADTIAAAFFGVHPSDFTVSINDTPVKEVSAAYEFVYSPEAGDDGFSRRAFEVEDVGEIAFDYVVKFRAREKDPAHPDLAYGSLPAAQRGARIYCNNRLAAGPTLLDLKTGMHNFYATDYLESIVRADAIDRGTIDFINTNRTQFREDNEVYQKLKECITEVMTKAIAAHASWREGKIADRIDGKIRATTGLRWIDSLPKAQKDAARKVLKVIAIRHDLNSPEFEEIAPNLLNAVTANDVLMRMIELRNDPRSLERVAEHLIELGQVERGHILTHYRGRRSGIEGLNLLIEQGELAKRKDPRTEKKLQELLKKHAWLVKPEYGTFVASDVWLTTTLSKLAKELGVDDFAKPHAAAEGDDATRPDLVFLLGDTYDPHIVTVVELKSPTLYLEFDHLRQLKNYMREIRTWLVQELGRDVDVQGMLVGKMPEANTSIRTELELTAEIKERGRTEKWEVVGLQSMLQRTRSVHMQMIAALEKETDDDEEAEQVAHTAPRLIAQTR